MSSCFRIARFLLALVLTGYSAFSADSVYQDGAFAPADWTTIQTAGNGSVATSLVPAGGNPDAYRRVDHQNFSGVLVAFHYRNGATYNPALGAVSTLSFSIDQLAILNHAGIGVGVLPAIQQNGINYLPSLSFLVNSSFNWQTLSMTGLGAADFRTVASASEHPDFSASGAPLLLGFVTANDNGGATLSRAAGFDNWNMVVTPVPESGTLALIGLGLVAVVAFHRRHAGPVR
ncbi:MAG TPA: PEP-CTERM sorting domain-containing protein [Methylomirabilota bacterium]|nr:PEP-CTERM sorting domain-containing protein [Methylomirabilota bacterium]